MARLGIYYPNQIHLTVPAVRLLTTGERMDIQEVQGWGLRAACDWDKFLLYPVNRFSAFQAKSFAHCLKNGMRFDSKILPNCPSCLVIWDQCLEQLNERLR